MLTCQTLPGYFATCAAFAAGIATAAGVLSWVPASVPPLHVIGGQ